MLRKAVTKRARSEAMRKSVARQRPSPAARGRSVDQRGPSGCPSRAACPRSAADLRWLRRLTTPGPGLGASERWFMLLMSAPAENPRPAPVSATQRTWGSSSQSISALAQAIEQVVRRTHSGRSGRFSVIKATPSSRLSRMTVRSSLVSDIRIPFSTRLNLKSQSPQSYPSRSVSPMFGCATA